MGICFLELLTCAAAPVLLVGVCLGVVAAAAPHDSDFGTFWSAGHDVLHGRSPYPALDSLPHTASRLFAPFVYPPLTAFAMAPLALLPYRVATVLFLLLSLAAIWLALRLLGVRDWRCYGAVYACAPVYEGLGLGAIGPFLLLGLAAAWRYRDRAVAVGVVVAFVVSAKLFLWPVWLWLVRTRRYRAAAVSAVVGVGGVVASWAAIGFEGLREYPHLLARLTELVGPHSYSVYSLGRSLGMDSLTAERSVYVLTLVLLGLVAWLVRDDRRLFVAAIALSLLATPILWLHYLVVLVVPVAVTTRRLSPLWIALLAVWFDSASWTGGSAWIAPILLGICGVAAAAMWRRVPTRRPALGPKPAL